jgi:lipopolysaccharide heptosyltransferase I
MRILIVRLGSLGDIIHALPAVSALDARFPDASIEWLVDWRNREVLQYVSVIDRLIVLEAPGGLTSWLSAIKVLRQSGYDAAIDFQGLLKSAVLARASGAGRVIGFTRSQLREQTASPFYTETVDAGDQGHVIGKNLRLASVLGADPGRIRFPLEPPESGIVSELFRRTGWPDGQPFAIVNPAAAWPNKRWPPDRLGTVAERLRSQYGLASVVIWGPGETELAETVAARSGGAAVVAPATTIGELLALTRAARLVISGDTGPLHVATALGIPVVGIFGPTSPVRNGPWVPDDVSVSRFEACGCHHQRRCHRDRWCLADIQVDEVMSAVERRFAASHG